jgi:hypothetical protein
LHIREFVSLKNTVRIKSKEMLRTNKTYKNWIHTRSFIKAAGLITYNLCFRRSLAYRYWRLLGSRNGVDFMS